MNRIIILDNSPASYMFHPRHAVSDTFALFTSRVVSSASETLRLLKGDQINNNYCYNKNYVTVQYSLVFFSEKLQKLTLFNYITVRAGVRFRVTVRVRIIFSFRVRG